MEIHISQAIDENRYKRREERLETLLFGTSAIVVALTLAVFISRVSDMNDRSGMLAASASAFGNQTVAYYEPAGQGIRTYANEDLGFRMTVPQEVFLNSGISVPIVVFESDGDDTVYVATRTSFDPARGEEVENSYKRFDRERRAHGGTGGALAAITVKEIDDDELTDFVQDEISESCEPALSVQSDERVLRWIVLKGEQSGAACSEAKGIRIAYSLEDGRAAAVADSLALFAQVPEVRRGQGETIGSIIAQSLEFI